MLRASFGRFAGVAGVVSYAAVAGGCGGGGGGGGGGSAGSLGLQLPNQMAVITPDPTATTQDWRGQDIANFPPDCDYFMDQQSVHVYDPAIEPIKTVNEILCELGQTRYDVLVNHGAYLAQVDEKLCGGENGDDNSQTGQSSGGAASQPDMWAVDCTRANANAIEYVRLWVPQTDDGVDSTIRAKLQVFDGVTATEPFGDFTLDFVGVDDANPDVNNPIMHGVLETLPAGGGSVGFDFFFQQGDPNVDPGLNHHAEITAASIAMSSDQSSGVAHIHVDHREDYSPSGDTGLESDEYLLAFDDTHLLRQVNGGPQLAFRRDIVHESVWQYNLYYNTGANQGQRVDLDSGFSFTTQSGEYGFIGYWGLWAPPNVTIHNGDVVNRMQFGDNTTTPYTILLAPGKLIHFVKNTLDLANLGATVFEYYDFTVNPMQRFHVVYQNAEFDEIEQWDDPTQSWIALGSPIKIDTAALGFVHFFCQSLNGDVFFRDGDSFVTYFAQTFVNGSDAIFAGGSPVTLYGYFQCVRSGILGTEADNGDIYAPDATDVAAPTRYRFDSTTLTLELDVNGDGSLWLPSGLANGETISSGPFMWGMRTGPLVLDTSGFTTMFDIFSASDFYAYETGPNSWNQFAAAVDGNGQQVVFDAPLQFSYTHDVSNDRNNDSSHDGLSYMLNYGGRGQLWGIPNSGVDLDQDGIVDRFYPDFSLKDGTLLGPTGIEYVVKAIEVEQTLAFDPAGAPGLDLSGAAALVLPDGTNYVIPDNGATPVITDPPAVIAGVLQGTLSTLDH